MVLQECTILAPEVAALQSQDYAVGLDATDNSWKIFAERPLKDKALRSSLLQAPAQKLGTLRLHPQEMV